MSKTEQYTEARQMVANARHAVEVATTSKARREAYEALEFWTGKAAFLAAWK